MQTLVKITPERWEYRDNSDVFLLSKKNIDLLVSLIPDSGIVRINAHKDYSDKVQEMFIAIRQDYKMQLHCHFNKSESFHIIRGEMDVVLNEDENTIKQIVSLSEHDVFYYRLDQPLYHRVVPKTHIVVFHEVTTGPFIQE